MLVSVAVGEFVGGSVFVGVTVGVYEAAGVGVIVEVGVTVGVSGGVAVIVGVGVAVSDMQGICPYSVVFESDKSTPPGKVTTTSFFVLSKQVAFVTLRSTLTITTIPAALYGLMLEIVPVRTDPVFEVIFTLSVVLVAIMVCVIPLLSGSEIVSLNVTFSTGVLLGFWILIA